MLEMGEKILEQSGNTLQYHPSWLNSLLVFKVSDSVLWAYQAAKVVTMEGEEFPKCSRYTESCESSGYVLWGSESLELKRSLLSQIRLI